ncbi:MAG: DEAD/DEAH box helicase [Planctomycetes bacterium]|nr:DEAD/DEAH box helicase [Planctomycetota bacterium]
MLAINPHADWPVHREALEALLRRFAFGKRDGLVITARPARGALYGKYRTSRPGATERPYTTLLQGIDPPRGSCDCADFVRSSLGLCKHLLTVLEALHAKPRALKRALAAEEAAAPAAAARAPRLAWDPIRPLTGRGDWLERVRKLDTDGADHDGAAERAGRWFGRAKDGARPLRDAYVERPERRLALVRDLLAAVREDKSSRGADRAWQDPALRALLVAEEERLQRVLEDAGSAGELRAALRTLKQHLYPYQREGVERFLDGKRLLLADDMGLGKTAQAIAGCHALWHAGRIRRGLLVVPAALKPQWLREWQHFTDAPATIIEGNPEERRRAFESCKSGFLIGNYEQLVRDLETIHRWRPDLIVLDEAQRIKNWSTKTALYVKKLEPPYRLVLTGTPMENRVDELASILEWVDSFAVEPKWRLAPWHTAFADGHREVSGARNLDTLRERIAPWMVRRIRKEVLSQLPARTDTRVPVELTPEQREEHDALSRPILQLVNIGKTRPLTQAQFLRLMQLLTAQRIISNGLGQLRYEEVWPEISRFARPSESLLKSLSSPKLLELRELLSQVVVGQRRKVVIFSQWLRMLRLANWAVGDLLADCGARALFFSGEEGQKRRTQNLVDFHDDPDVKVLFASDAGGVGLNLQHAANCLINLELPWNPAVLEQRIGRIYRLGQKHPIDVYNLVCEEGIESRIFQLVGNKKAFFSGLFDGSSNEVTFESAGGFMSRVEKIVEPVQVPELGAVSVGAGAGAVDGAGEEDPAAERGLEAVLAQADEAGGGQEQRAAAEATAALPAAAPAATAPEGAPPTPVEAAAPASGPTLISGTEAAPPALALSSPTASEPEPAPAGDEVRRLFSRLSVKPTPSGGISIEAPPEAASALAALFEGMARMLQSAGGR